MYLVNHHPSSLSFETRASLKNDIHLRSASCHLHLKSLDGNRKTRRAMCLWSQVPRSGCPISWQASRSVRPPRMENPGHIHMGPTSVQMTPHLCETHPSATWLLTAPHSCCWGRSAAGSSACHPPAHPRPHSCHSRDCSLGAERSGPRCPHPQTERAPEDITKRWSNTSSIKKHEN